MKKKQIISAIFFVLLAFFAQAAEGEPKDEEKSGDLKSEIKAYIRHHLEDTHDFSIGSYTTDEGKKKYIGFSLPVILWDGELVSFSSGKLKHGKAVYQVGSKYYKLYHGKIYRTDAEGTITYDSEKKVTNNKPLDLSMTKSVVTMLFTGALMFFLFRSLANSYKTNGSIAAGVGRFFEPIVMYIRDDIAIPNIGENHYKRYMSYLLTIFFFVWFLNILGLSPLGINVTGNIAVTFGLALLTFLITNLTANKNYWLHIFWMPGVPILMKILLAPIELLGVFIKPFSLLIRLYANIQAGHIVLMSLIGLMFIFNNWLGSSLSFVLAFVISIIEVLVALLQAYIFTMLSALYFGFAVEEHEETH